MSFVRKLAGSAVLLWALTLAAVSPALAQTDLPGPRPPPPAVVAPAMPPATPGAAAVPDEDYRLGSGDKLKLTVYGEDDLTAEFYVDGSGQVQLPLIGPMKAAGLSVHEFVADVTAKLADGYLKNPRVSVQVENYRPFYIIGEVNKPGEYPYESGLSILGAVALAGGYTYRADDTEVYIRRGGAEKEVSLPADNTTKISPGDIVRIGERIF